MAHRRANQASFSFAKELRCELTLAERMLWHCLRMRQADGIRFRRQHAIGPYIADFCAVAELLIVEVDGGQHLDQEEYDRVRTKYFEEKGYRVLRFWNHEVLRDLDAVMQVILHELQSHTPS
jgi:very-short-patch-repair endonuclease